MKDLRSSILSLLNLSAGSLTAIIIMLLLSNCNSIPIEEVGKTPSLIITQSPSPALLGMNSTKTPISTLVDLTYTPSVINSTQVSSQTPNDVKLPIIDKKYQWNVSAILDINWSPNSEHFVAVLEKVTGVYGIQLFDVNSEGEIWFIEDNAHSAVFSPIGDSIITTSTYYGIREFDVTDGHTRKIIDDPYNCLGGHQIVIAKNGRTVYSGYSPLVRGSSPHISNIFQWDLDLGLCLGKFVTQDGWLRSLLISPENLNLVAVFSLLDTNDGIETIVWEIETQKEICSFDGVVLAFEPNGDLFATSYNNAGELNLWNVTNCILLQTLVIDHNPISLANSPDGKLIVTGETSIIIWDALSGELIQEQKDIPNEVQQLAFSPDGKFLISIHPAKRLDDYASIILWELVH